MSDFLEFLHKVCAISDERTAKQFFKAYVRELEKVSPPLADPTDTARQNIGWMFGEGMTMEVRAIWRNACGAYHPFLGDMRTELDPQKVFDAGYKMAELQGSPEEKARTIRELFRVPTAWDRIAGEDDL